MDLWLRIHQGEQGLEIDRVRNGDDARKREDFLTGSFTPIPMSKTSITATQQVFEVVVPNGATITNMSGIALRISKFDPPAISTFDGGIGFTASQLIAGVTSVQTTPTSQTLSVEDEDAEEDQILDLPLSAAPLEAPLEGQSPVQQSIVSNQSSGEHRAERRRSTLPTITFALGLSSGSVFMAFVDITVNGTRRMGYAVEIL